MSLFCLSIVFLYLTTCSFPFSPSTVFLIDHLFCFLSSFSPLRVIEQINQRIFSKQQESERLKRKVTENPDPKAMEKATERHNKMRSAWIQRKLQCMDAIDMLAEGTGKKLKVLLVCFVFEFMFLFLSLTIVFRTNYLWKRMMQLVIPFHC
jgi:hypothetical protein